MGTAGQDGSMNQLEALLQQCVVKLTLPDNSWGTGFFVTPEKILTCTHVVQRANGQPIQVQCQNKKNWGQAKVEPLLPNAYDLTLLKITLPINASPPCVYLDDLDRAIISRDPLYMFGYPDIDYPDGCPVTFNCEGLTGDEPALIKFAMGQVRPGMSGSPLLNQRTGKVCGIVKFTRDRGSDLGGGAVPVAVILTQFPELVEQQRDFHQKDRRWVQQMQVVNRSVIWECVHPLNGHSDSVKVIAISTDGRMLASGSSDKTIKLWNLSTGELLHNMEANIIVVKYIVFSPDGQTLVSCGKFEAADGNIKLWDVSTGKLKKTIREGLANSGIFSCNISPDGQTLAIGQLGAVKLWNLHVGEELNILEADGLQVNSLAFSSDGQFLVAGCIQGDIRIWDWRNQKLLRTIKQSSNFIDFVTSFFRKVLWCITISPNGQVIASAGENLPLTLWNFNSGTKWHTPLKSGADIHSIAFSPDGQFLASGSQDKTMSIWNIHTGDLLYTSDHVGEVNCVAFSPDHETLISADNSGIIKIWRVSYDLRGD